MTSVTVLYIMKCAIIYDNYTAGSQFELALLLCTFILVLKLREREKEGRGGLVHS